MNLIVPIIIRLLGAIYNKYVLKFSCIVLVGDMVAKALDSLMVAVHVPDLVVYFLTAPSPLW